MCKLFLAAHTAVCSGKVLTEFMLTCRSTGAAGTYLWGGLCRIDVLDAPLTTSLVFYGSKALRIEAMPLLESSPGGVSQEESSLAYLEREGFPVDFLPHVLLTVLLSTASSVQVA